MTFDLLPGRQDNERVASHEPRVTATEADLHVLCGPLRVFLYPERLVELGSRPTLHTAAETLAPSPGTEATL